MSRLADALRTLIRSRADLSRLIAQLREDNRRRPRLQREFDRAGLP